MKTDFMMPAFCNLTEFKVCRDCKETKPAVDFYRILSGKYAGSLVGHCLPCQRTYQSGYQAKNKDKVNRKSKEWHAAHPENHRAATLKYECAQLGITVLQYHSLELFQNNKCAICKQPQACGGKRRLCIDHCHATKKVRGLLCDLCNKMLGQAKDSIETLSNAIEYLERGSSVQS